jgi:hypothetical protein
MDIPKISFGIIVLNGHPFLFYNLRALYPWAHQIIVSEGASPNASHAARSDGHSLDGTLEFLREFKTQNDPENKLVIVTAEDEGHENGFWPGEKDEQSVAYAKRATGNWLWQVDVDEFYRNEDIINVIEMLNADPTITAVTFPEIPFWGSFDYRCDGPYLRFHYSKFHRLFKWEEGFTYATHRPPTVLDKQGRDLRSIHWVDSEKMAIKRIRLYHYTQIFLGQVKAKMAYYENLISSMGHTNKIIKDTDVWFEKTFDQLKDPYHVHTVNTWPSWLVPFEGQHPEVIRQMITDIETGDVREEMREMSDVVDVLKSDAFSKKIKKLKRRSNFRDQPIRLCKKLIRRRITLKSFLKELIGIIRGPRRLFPEA